MKVDAQATIQNRYGFHFRPSTAFYTLAFRFRSVIQVSCREKTVNGKSLIDLLTLEAMQGVEINIAAEGDDAQEAVDALKALIDSGFNSIDEDEFDRADS